MPRFRIDRRTRKVYPIPSPTEDVPTYYFPHPLTEGDIMELLDSRGTPEEETTQILEELREMGYSIALGVGEKQPRRIFVYPIEITDFIRKQFRKGITEKTVVKKVASILGRDSQTVAENWVEWVHTLSGEIGPQTLTGEEKGGQLRGFDALAQQQAGFRKFVRGQAPSKLKRQLLRAIDAERKAEARFFATPEQKASETERGRLRREKRAIAEGRIPGKRGRPEKNIPPPPTIEEVEEERPFEKIVVKTKE